MLYTLLSYFRVTLVTVLSTSVLASAALGMPSPEKVIYSFTGLLDGASPTAGLTFDAAGNLYGTTTGGGNPNCYCGVAFELSRSGDHWAENTLYVFSGGADGADPSSGLIFGREGNLYGTVRTGGAYGFGAVYELSPGKGKSWQETVLYSFQGTLDGAYPAGNLVFDAFGNLYGTTQEGGARDSGTVFELTLQSDGSWKKAILHSFKDIDGSLPTGGLIFDKAGNIYGMTDLGGIHEAGVVFALLRGQQGNWTEKVLHVFGNYSQDPGYPESGLYLKGGVLFGTECAYASGAVFSLSRTDHQITADLLHIFPRNADDGSSPCGPVIADTLGNLYGTTLYTFSNDTGYGTVFELTPTGSGSWKETILHRFNGNDGLFAYSGLMMDSAGNLYGTTWAGGAHNVGVVYEIAP